MEEQLQNLLDKINDVLYNFGQWFSKIVNAFVNAYQADNLEKPLIVLSFTWACLAILVVLYIFIRYDLEHKVRIEKNKSTDFPDSPNPAQLEFCIYGKITIRSFLATLMLLFYKKSLIYTKEELASGKGEHNVIKKNELNLVENLSLSEDRFEKKLLMEIGQNNEIPFKRIKEINKYPDTMQGLIDFYSEWKYLESTNIKIVDYYENVGAALTGVYFFLILGVVIFTLTLKYTKIVIVFYILFALIVLYMYRVSKRTYKCNDERAKWLMFKKNLYQFNKIELKDLPDPKLWAKYYAYSLVLGNEKEVYNLFMKKENKNINMGDTNAYDDYFNNMRDLKKVCSNFKYAYKTTKVRKSSKIKL